MAYQHDLLWRLEKPGAARVVLARVVETLRAGIRCDISSHGPPVVPCRAPLAIEGQEDLNGQVVAFDVMALPGPSSWGTDRTRVRRCAERVAAVSVQQRDECPGFRTPIRAALRTPLLDHWSIVAVCCWLIDSVCCLRTATCLSALCEMHLHARAHCLHC